ISPSCFRGHLRRAWKEPRERFPERRRRREASSPPRPMTTARDPIEREGGPPSSATSRSLLARVQANESDAWERLVNLYAPLVLHWCRCGGLQHHDVADVFQEVFQSVVAY